MDDGMKLLIAYDGSSSADTALDDLARARLPAKADAIFISVTTSSCLLSHHWVPACPTRLYGIPVPAE